MTVPVKEDLIELQLQCSFPGWDGPKTKPVAKQTLKNVLAALPGLPLAVPGVSIGADPLGQLFLEWCCNDNSCRLSVDKRDTFTVSGSYRGRSFRLCLGTKGPDTVAKVAGFVTALYKREAEHGHHNEEG